MIMRLEEIYLIVLTFGIFNYINGQDNCALNSIRFINIAANATLWWEVAPSSPCEVTSFSVEVTGENEGQYYFNVSQTFLDLSFLNICYKFYFTVIPISNGVVGMGRILVGHIPFPPDADLEVEIFSFFLHETHVTFEWNLRNQTFGECRLIYRLTLEDLDRGTMEDIYVDGKSAYTDTLSPCIQYEISIRAINLAHPTIEGPIKTIKFELPDKPQVAPTLKLVESKATSINTTWELEGDTNRCPLKSLYIEGGLYFNKSISLHDLSDTTLASIQLEGLRPSSMYYMKVYVENSGGRSQSTLIAIQTTPLS